MTPGRRRKTLTERLRAIAGRSDRAPRVMCVCKHAKDDHVNPGGCCIGDCPCRMFREPKTRVSTASYVRSHRDTVWIPPDPPRKWFEEQGVEPMDPTVRKSIQLRRWF